MEILMKNAPFGRVISITGMNLHIEIKEELLDRNMEQEVFDGEKLHKLLVGTVGEIFMIGGPSTSDKIHFALFEEVKLVSTVEDATLNRYKTKALAVAKVIGYQDPDITEKLKFKRGIGHYPKFNAECYLLTEQEKADLFFINQEEGIRIGKVSNLSKEDVIIHTDKFLGKHSVVLGSTGSGKSCTVASIIQKILNTHEFSHMVFFDLHNEYSDAFIFNDSHYKVNKVEPKDLQLPYWLLSFEEFVSIFLGDVNTSSDNIRILKEEILNLKAESHKGIENKVGKINAISINSPLYYSIDELITHLKKLNKRTLWKSDDTPAIDENTGEYLPNSGSRNVDRPGKGSDNVLQDKVYYNQLTSLVEKLESVRIDRRYNFLFGQTYHNSITLYDYIIELLSIPKEMKQNQMTILDLSKVPSEILPIIIGVLSKLCFEYKLWEKDPKKLPIYLVMEEAHNYIPKESSNATKIPKRYIERIAKEGRKYGLSQLIISQRPSELSETIIAQCSNFIILRVTNPSDQSFVHNVLPDHLSTLTNMIPLFQNGEALIVGECVTIPTRVIIDFPTPPPNSGDVPFSTAWKSLMSEYSVEDTIHRWWDVVEDEKTD